MDYFTADQDVETKRLLKLVESYHTNKVLQQIGNNEYNGALGDLKYTLNRFPNHPRGLFLMGLYGRLTKKHGLVVPYYEKALRLFPQHAMTYAQYGAYLVTLGSIDEGIKRLERALEMDSDLVVANVWLAGAYKRKGNVELSRQAEAKARSLGFKGQIVTESP
jgi:Tfp pilus assembly protein PilF